MISVEQALEKVLSFVDVLEPERKPILDCLGQVLAQDIYSDIDVPSHDSSAMDGYAIKCASTRGAGQSSAKVLSITGEVAAGDQAKQPVTRDTAVRIMTGAPIPPGADCVIPFEDTDELQRKAAGSSAPLKEIGILKEMKQGNNIRPAGEDVHKGALVLEKGRTLRPWEIGVLASLGMAQVPVIRRPTIAVLATGSELVNLGEPLPPGKIYNSNTYSLTTLVRRYGGIPKVLGVARDVYHELVAKVREGLSSDMIVTSGGVSQGDYDMVKDVLASQGEITFWTVRMKPGKPIAFGFFNTERGGKVKRVPHLGLPGFPVSAAVSFELFARPSILKMMGKTNLDKPMVTAILEEPVANRSGRRFYARAVVTKRQGQYLARLSGGQQSGALSAMAQANGLLVVPEETLQLKKGDAVQVLMLDWDEEQG